MGETLEELEAAIAAAANDPNISLDDFDELLAREEAASRRLLQKGKKEVDVRRTPLGKQAASLRRQADALEAQAPEESATASEAKAAAYATFQRRVEAAELRQRADVMEARAPFEGVPTEELERRHADAEIAWEDLERQKKALGADSPATLRRLTEQAEAVVVDRLRISKEIARRTEMESARAAMASFAAKEAEQAAAEEHRAQWQAELDRLKAFYPGGGLVMANAPPRWELERAREMLTSPPPEELVTQHRARIMREKEAELKRFEFLPQSEVVR
jgi:hypothetical protein